MRAKTEWFFPLKDRRFSAVYCGELQLDMNKIDYFSKVLFKNAEKEEKRIIITRINT